MQIKHFLLFTVIILASFGLRAQFTNATPGDIGMLSKATLYVVLQGKEVTTNVKYSRIENDSLVESEKKRVTESEETNFNKTMKFAMKNLWKASKYIFITEEEFEEKKSDAGAYFLFISKMKIVDKETHWLDYLILAKGGKAKKADKMPWLAAIPVSFSNVSEQYYLYKLPGLVQFLQAHMDYVYNNSPVTEKSIEEYYNKKTKEIKHGTLYLLQEELTNKVYDMDAIEKIYSGSIKFVEQKDIDEAIRKQDPNVLYLHKVGPEKTVEGGFCRKFILAAKGGELLYINEHKISKSFPDGLIEYDFKQFKK
jgi:hypothetical protein